MKNIISLILLTSFIFFGCGHEQIELNDKSIYGTWQLVEVFSGPPSGDGWQKVEDGYIYEIRSDSSFRSTIASECETGTLIITLDKITFNYNCEGFTMGTEEPAGIFKYSYSLDNYTLQLDPLNINCFEGCAYRFKKIADEEVETD